MFKSKKRYSRILMSAIFATGFSGIVAEYLLSTLATYFLGDSIIQWALIVSTMMFSMGLGSRISKRFTKHLALRFLVLEFILSLVVSFVPLLVYTASAFTNSLSVLIYLCSITIGILIGMEIPLVTRINDQYDDLRVNISKVLENDYYGSLIGGVFFAFIGIPFLGLNYTPFVLGFVNFSVAVCVYIYLNHLIDKSFKIPLNISIVLITLFLISGVTFSKPIIKYGEQKKYKDKIVYAHQSKYQRIVITQWKDEFWLWLNGNEQLCTMDEMMYHEPLIHPAMTLHPNPQDILVLGGGDGCAVREILKYSSVKNITLVDLDPEMTKLGENYPLLTKLNKNSLTNSKVNVINKDGFVYLSQNKNFYDIIIVDLPDPRNVELNRLYTEEFYRTAYKHLRPGGIIITQAGSPYFATKAFKCIVKTMAAAGFNTIPLHNQVLSLGEWGWSLGVKTDPAFPLKDKLKNLTFKVPTKWLNNDAMQLITSFGKEIYPGQNDSVKINRIQDPVLYRYYLKGNWDLY